MNQHKKLIKWLVAAVLLATAIFLFVWRMWPYNNDDIRRCVLSTEHTYSYVIKVDGSPLLYFDGVTNDSVFINLSEKEGTATEHSVGCWINNLPIIPSCKGTIATVFTRTDSCLLDTAHLRSIIREEITNYESTLNFFDHARREIDYYIDTHSDNDEGFDDVIRYSDSLDIENSRIDTIATLLKKAIASNKMSVVKDERFYAVYRDINNREIRRECLYVPTYNDKGNMLIQLNDSITPEGVTAITPWHFIPFHTDELKETVFIMGRQYINDNDMMSRDIEMIPENISGDTLTTFPRVNISKGSPVFNHSGFFIGITAGDTIINRSTIRKSL